MKECCATYLHEQFGGDADIMKEIYDEYVSSLGTKLQDADATLAAADWIQLDRTAHTIKGNALAVGDGEMAQTAIDLRGAAQLQDSEQAATFIARLKDLARLL